MLAICQFVMIISSFWWLSRWPCVPKSHETLGQFFAIDECQGFRGSIRPNFTN
uniref:Uncharacterized protein n=1 Tax=Arundo donax TaxID=35708 RepID=A0A0A9FMX2_ARUDO